MLALIVTFNLDGMTDEELKTAAETQLAGPVAAMPGLIAKTWLADTPENTYGGSYLFESREALEAYEQSAFFKEFTSDPRIVNITAHVFDVMEGPSRVTNGLGPVAAVR
jgi:hypothetical protein